MLLMMLMCFVDDVDDVHCVDGFNDDRNAHLHCSGFGSEGKVLCSNRSTQPSKVPVYGTLAVWAWAPLSPDFVARGDSIAYHTTYNQLAGQIWKLPTHCTHASRLPPGNLQKP